MVIGRAPPFALIVIDAAGVEAEVAADRAHVAVGRAGDVTGGLRHHRIVPDDVGVLGELREGDRGAELQRVFVGFDRVQLAHAVHIDQHGRRQDAAPDVDDKIGAAAERLGVRMFGARGQRFVERCRLQHLEVGQGVHQAAPFRQTRSFPRKRDAGALALGPRFRGDERRLSILLLQSASSLLQHLEHPVRCHRQVIEAQADGVGDSVGECRQEGGE